jgi:anti-sigma factor RsiW
MTEHQHDEEHQIEEEPHSCHDLLRSLSDYVDGTLDDSICAEIERHMSDCERCHIVIDTLRKTVELYRTLPTPPLPDDVRERLLLRLNLDDYTLKQESPTK